MYMKVNVCCQICIDLKFNNQHTVCVKWDVVSRMQPVLCIACYAVYWMLVSLSKSKLFNRFPSFILSGCLKL